MTWLLAVGSSVGLVLLIVHSWRMRGRLVTLSFFLAGIVFGHLRANVVWWVVSRVEDNPQALTPYLPQGGILPDIGHSSHQVALGWVFALYLAWTISELILRRLPRFAGRVFMVAGLSALFMTSIGYCMETTAVRAGWWYWTLSTRTTLFGNVNVPAMWAWFSVTFDFLMPFLVVVCAATRGKWLKWLWVPLPMAAHMGTHLLYVDVPWAALNHHLMLLLIAGLMFFSKLRMVRGELRQPASRGEKLVAGLPAVVLMIFFGTVLAANLLSGGGMPEMMTLAPLLMLCLLAWGRLPVAVVAGVSLLFLIVGWPWVGVRALYALVPVGTYAYLHVHARFCEWIGLRPALPVLAAVLLAWSACLSFADMTRGEHWRQAWLEGDQLAVDGKMGEALKAYDRADHLRPRDTTNSYHVVRGMMLVGDLPPQQSALLFEYRMPRLIGELEQVIVRDPEWLPPREDAVTLYLLSGELDKVTQHYTELSAWRPKDPEVTATLGYFLLRDGKIAEAEEMCTRAIRSRRPPVEALINLGVIRFFQHRDEEARVLWEQALKGVPGHPIAGLNLDRLKTSGPGRDIDLRYLARPVRKRTASMALLLAAFGRRFTEADRVRLLLEATQLDPMSFYAHLNLARIYLGADSIFQDRERARWYARRAVAIAEHGGSEKDLVKARELLRKAEGADR